MHLTVREIHNILEEMAPAALKESYDNVGLMIGDFEEEVSDILIALDCTMEVIEEAKILGCNLILTHHPLLFFLLQMLLLIFGLRVFHMRGSIERWNRCFVHIEGT